MKALRVTMLGDSLTAGSGLLPHEVLPVRLQAGLRTAGISATVENAGISGDTTAAGFARLGYILEGQPQLLLLALSANDGLRGHSPEEVKANLAAIIGQVRRQGCKVILLGMYAPLYQSQAYAAAFNAIHTDLSIQFKLPLYPFLLDGVALQLQFNQEDGMHPNVAGVDEIVKRLTPFLATELRSLTGA